MKLGERSEGKITKISEKITRFPQELVDEAIKLVERRFRRRTRRVGLIIFLACWATFLYLFRISPNFPSPNELRDYIPKQTTFVYGANQDILDGFYDENRKLVSYEQIPEDLRNAILAAEDENLFKFYHVGFDPWAIARALIENKRADNQSMEDKRGARKRSGASTLHQQIVGLVWGEADSRFSRKSVTYTRKLYEIRMAYRLYYVFSKKDIFTIYCNLTYFGDGRYGVDRAAWHYFRKPLDGLTLGECALLAGLIQDPARYSPWKHPEAALGRRNYILHRMAMEGFISDSQERHEENLNLKVQVAARRHEFINSLNYPLEEVKKELKRFGYSRDAIWGHGALKIYTTIDPNLQKISEKALGVGIERYMQERKKAKEGLKNSEIEVEKLVQGGVVILDRTSAIKAMVGGYDFYDEASNGKFNRVTQGARQPGSAFKPIVYTAALEMGKKPLDIVLDAPIRLPDKIDFRGNVIKWWMPQNYPVQNRPLFWGPMPIFMALKDSRNLPAIHLAIEIGLNKVISTAHNLGITTEIDPHPPLAIGATGVKMIDLANVYGTIANDGIFSKPHLIESIKDSKGKIRFQYHSEPLRVISEETSRQMIAMLRLVVLNGTAASSQNPGSISYLGIKKDEMLVMIPVAGKTGTTNDFTDVWFAGFTPDGLVVLVRLGFDDALRKLGPPPQHPTGANLALPIFSAIMREIYKAQEIKDFSPEIYEILKSFSSGGKS